MIRQLWARIGRRKEKSEKITDMDSPERSVVPLRNPKSSPSSTGAETMIVTKKDHVERFNEAVNHLVEKLEGIHDHLGKQVGQNERLLEQIEHLPDVLRTLPESVDRQEQAVRSLLSQLEEKSRQDQQIMDSLSSLPEETSRQNQTLGEIHQQMAESVQTGKKLNEYVNGFSDALGKLDQDTMTQTEWIQHMSRTFTATDRYLKLTLAKQNRRFLWVFVICVGISLLSIIGLLVGLFMLRGTA